MPLWFLPGSDDIHVNEADSRILATDCVLFPPTVSPDGRWLNAVGLRDGKLSTVRLELRANEPRIAAGFAVNSVSRRLEEERGQGAIMNGILRFLTA